MNKRFLLYSHDGVGLGHTRRNLAIAAALIDREPDTSVLIATGTDAVSGLGVPEHVGVLKLPGLLKVDNGCYVSRQLKIPPEEIWTLRSSLLLAAVASFRPTVILVDKHPFGANGELRQALACHRRTGGRAVLGLRDILDEQAAVIHEWASQQLSTQIVEYYDRVLIYGDARLFNPIIEYGFPSAVASRSTFCGYVVNRAGAVECADHHPPLLPRRLRPRPLVLATAGGGEDGFALLEAFTRASASSHWEGCVVSGPQAPREHVHALREMAGQAGVTFHTFLPCLPEQFHRADALVCKGGYNTLIEAVACGIPTICVPRTVPRTEQLIRAQALARLGLIRLLEPDRLSIDALRAEVEAALRTAPALLTENARALIPVDGAQRAAELLLEISGA